MNEKDFNNYLKEINISLSNEQFQKFETYKNLLQEYNKKFNLTSIIEDQEIYIKHFYDSICILKTNKIKTGDKLLDIGTGAGFPGIPLAIIRDDIKITLVESNSKKCNFLNIVKDTLKLNNIEIINERAEDFSSKNREAYDIVTSRAVSHLQVLLELEIPSLKVNGYFLPLKSNITEELETCKTLMEKLNVKLENTISYLLPFDKGKRTIPIIIKTKNTDIKYPRNYSKIIKDLKK